MVLSNTWRNFLLKPFRRCKEKDLRKNRRMKLNCTLMQWIFPSPVRVHRLTFTMTTIFLSLSCAGPLLWPSATRMSPRLQCWQRSSLARGLCLHSLSLRKPRMKEHHCMCRHIPFTVHTRAQSQTCAASSSLCTVDWIPPEIQAISSRWCVSLTNTSLRFSQVSGPVLDYIPESNLAEIKLFLHESKEGKRIKTQAYRQATYGKTRTDVIWTQLCTPEYSEAEAVTLSLWRGPFESSSSQPCCKHHYFTPPSLSLLLLFCSLLQCSHSRPRKEMRRRREDFKDPIRAGESQVARLNGKVQEQHANHTVNQKKKGHYKCCQSMCSVQECSMGPSASETKTAQSVAPSPQCYHIRTSLAGKFLIYAVIFSCPPSSFCCHCWYWQGFDIQMPVAHSRYTYVHINLPYFHTCWTDNNLQQIKI